MKKLWKIFTKKFPIKDAAGGLVQGMMISFIYIQKEKWDLPKGD